MTCRGCIALSLCVPLFLIPSAVSADSRVSVESGAVWQARNDVRIPNDGGDRYALDAITGSGPYAFVRLSLEADLAGPHGLRFVYAPLAISEEGQLAQPVHFAGEDFAAGPTRARYQFNAHRLTYRYTVSERAGRQLYVGFTGLIRDAEVRLRQGALSARDSNVGFVPLLHVAGEYALSPYWKLSFDFDGLAAPQGRALDLGLRIAYQVDRDWQLSAGYRTLEGGVDNDEVYSFAWFNYATLGVSRRF